MILMIDNYDSFTYNLVQYLQILGAKVLVFRNDAVEISQIIDLKPKGIVISPGPGSPKTAGVSVSLIRQCAKNTPILGVCLGLQSIGAAFGATIGPAKSLMHGKTSMIFADGKKIFSGIKAPFSAMRYHSLAVIEDTVPDCLEITARADDDEIMGIRHKKYPVEGIQFHPESIMTPLGKKILRNFLNHANEISN